jgi:hypothetical protein
MTYARGLMDELDRMIFQHQSKIGFSDYTKEREG